MSLEQLWSSPEHLFYTVICVCLIVVSICFVMLVASVRSTLKKVEKSLSLVNKRVHQLEPILDGVAKIEDNVNEITREGQVYLEKLHNEAGKVMSEVTDALSHLKLLQEALEVRLEQDVPPILQETRQIVSGVNDITHDIQKKIKAADDLFQAVDEAGQTVRMVTGIVKGGLTGLAVQLASLAVGMKASIEYMTENIHKGGDDK